MTFYFHNSYQQSPVGFQLSKIDVASEALTKITETDISSAEFRSLMINSGVTCAIGSKGDTSYLVFHNLHVADTNAKQWYITLGVTAGPDSKKQFEEIVKKLFLDHSSFVSSLQNWFYETPEQQLSYAIHVDAFQQWLSLPAPNIKALPFYQLDNPIVNQYRSLVDELKKGSNRRLFLLVPESTVAYFFTQHNVFNKELPHFLFNPDEFAKLLHKDATLLNEKKGETSTKAAPIWDQLGITKEQFIQYVVTGAIVCASFIGMISHFVKRTTKRH